MKSEWILKFRIIGYVALLYVAILGIITLLEQGQVINENSFSSKLGSDDASIPFIIFFLFFGMFFAVLIYLFNSLIARRFIRINLPKALVYMSVAGLVAPLGEVVVNTIAVSIFGSPVFLYHVAPIHHGYTSLVMLVLWPTYGFHFYCFHEALAGRVDTTFTDSTIAMIMGIDGIIMETLVNILAVLLFSANIFYYLPSDLAHISSAAILPVYVLIGFVGLKLIHYIEGHKMRALLITTTCVLSGILFLLG